MTLAETQRTFGAWLRGDPAPRPDKRVRPGLRVYRNTYRAQLVACLQDSFPRTLDWIGGEAFHAAIVTHVARVPPSSWTLDAYARDFPETLGQLYPDDPEIADLAMLERALGDAFIGADAEPVSAAALGDVDWDGATLRFTPTLDMLQIASNAPALYTRLSAGEMPPSAERLPDPVQVLVWRQDMVSRYRTIDAAEGHALLLARAGTPFAALCAALVDVHGQDDGIRLAGGYLGQWLADGLITDIRGDDPCVSSSN